MLMIAKRQDVLVELCDQDYVPEVWAAREGQLAAVVRVGICQYSFAAQSGQKSRLRAVERQSTNDGLGDVSIGWSVVVGGPAHDGAEVFRDGKRLDWLSTFGRNNDDVPAFAFFHVHAVISDQLTVRRECWMHRVFVGKGSCLASFDIHSPQRRGTTF